MQGIRYYFNDKNENIEIKKCNSSIHSNKAHFHNEISLGLVENGGCRTQIGGNTYELDESTVLIIPAELVHKCNPVNLEQWKFRMLYINKEWFENSFNLEGSNIKFSYMKANEKMFASIKKLFFEIENNIMNIENESKLLKYISFLTDTCSTRYEEEILMDSDLEKIDKIKEYINDNYLNNVKLSDLAKLSDMSKYCLIRKFEEVQGLSPHKYITNLRINRSKELLKNNKDFADLALESGFYDQSHFIKYFKEYTGTTPMRYKKSCN